MMLSPHVSLREMTASPAAARRGISNDVPEHLLPRLVALATACLEPIRTYYGRPIVISSGYRNAKVNGLAGGTATSRHLKGEAADFEIPGIANLDLARWIATSGLPFDELILEFHEIGKPASGWIHVAHRAAPLSNAREIRHYTWIDGKKVTSLGLPR